MKGSAPLVAAAAGGAAAFVALAMLIRRDAVGDLDLRLLAWIASMRRDALAPVALQVTALGNGLTAGVIAVLSAALLVAARRRAEGLLVAVSTAGGIALQVMLKAVIARPRPDAEGWLVPATQLAFPSGHATNAAALYLALAIVVARLPLGPLVRRSLVTMLVLVVFLVAASRSWLGVHFPTDVLGGVLLGGAWAALCAALIQSRSAARVDPPDDAD